MPAAPQTVEAAGDDGALVTTIGAICQAWPDAVQQEIEQFNLIRAFVSIPMSRLESGMKAGRVVFAWSEILSWLSAPPSGHSPQEALELQLPLGVIASQKKVNVGQNIPDLFGGTAKQAPGAPASGEVAEPIVQPFTGEWTPQEIVRQIAVLPGVSGTLLATADGLLVAGNAPAPLNTETLAAFLPQIFGRMSSYSEEVKLGALRAVTVNTDSGPCAMFKAGKLYLAVVGKPGESVPETTLLKVAAEFAKSTQ
jgi:predicted regulator of Ras-like GTPase activity (Roadblock/LC7/MglB family)